MKFFVFSRINMALSALALLAGITHIKAYPLNSEHFVFFGLSVWWVYIFDMLSSRHLEDSESHTRRGVFIKDHLKILLILKFLIPVLLVYMVFELGYPFVVWPLFLFASLVAFFYSKGLWGFRIKSCGWNKTYIVALTWTLGTLAYPKFMIHDFSLDPSELFLAIVLFLLLFLDTYLLDYQDLNVDKKFHIKTAAHNVRLNHYFASSHRKLGRMKEENMAFVVSSWRYLFLVCAIILF